MYATFPTMARSPDSVRLLSLTQLNRSVYEAVIEYRSDPIIHFFPGQYLELIIDREAFPFSIASAFNNQKSLQHQDDHVQIIDLHIGVSTTNSQSQKIIDHLQADKPFSLSLPKGSCYYDDTSDDPIIIIAASTGFAQAKSIIEHCSLYQKEQAIHLYWGTREQESLYMTHLLDKWSRQLNNITIHIAIQDEDGVLPKEREHLTPSIPIRRGMLKEVLVEDYTDLSPFKIFLCGSPNMVHHTLKALYPLNLRRENTFSDVFEYAPNMDDSQ